MEEEEKEEVDSLCPECGHGFKVHIDRILADGKKCKIGK